MRHRSTILVMGVCAGLLFSAGACSHARHSDNATAQSGSTPTVTRGITSADEMKAAILRAVPPGTPMDAAMAFMQSEGFECSLVPELSPNGKTEMNTLFAQRTDGHRRHGNHRVWSVTLLPGDDGSVKSVSVDPPQTQ